MVLNKTFVIAGLVATTILGAATANILQARVDAATNSAVTTADSKPQTGSSDPVRGGHVGENGKREELLTGDTAEKVKAAALKAVPGGTVQRVETEVDGNGVYEAHMTKSDGTSVTVFFDSNFNRTSTQEGHGGPGKQL